ncbi:hypothetical protein [Myroides pelagicus]|uniref:Lipocalin-like domain-containing protein n=1 Tax=Myroides pelagicus TaxID=270914 RepID=A0A7K1GQ92_9FLAO|nr:hypothetical protein [Myroides pelagicus]MEC4114629.1 hypothetical protein [Myroides pelagicus]MTH30709.1 hypothetical protein [Myroides pelagicus]
MKQLVKYITILFAFIIYGCNDVDTKDLKELNGYWEIDKAIMPNGEEKDYTINSSIDFFQLDSLKGGFRQKLMPQFNGEYLTNDLQENFTISTEGSEVYLLYKTDYASWKEEVVKINKEEFVVKNENGIEYFYKRPVPFSLK